MEGGPQNNSVACIVQARMSSNRLPGKTLMPIPIASDKSLLLWIVEEVRKSKFQPNIYIATSLSNENDVLEAFCARHNVHCFRGDEDDVLSRFGAIVKKSKPATVVRLTADNPLIDVEALDETIAYHLEQKNDYTKTEGLPLGMNFEVVSSQAILKSDSEELSKSEREHVTLFIRNNKGFKKETYQFATEGDLKELRLTVDYPSDFLLVSTLLGFALQNETLRGLPLVQKIYREHPWLFGANAMNVQKRQFFSLAEELKVASETLKNLEYHKAASILEAHEEKDTI